MFVSKDRKRAVLFAFCLQYEGRGLVPKLRCGGLDPDARYKVTEVCPQAITFWGDGKSFGGDYLMNFGVNLDLKQPYQSAVLLIEAQ